MLGQQVGQILQRIDDRTIYADHPVVDLKLPVRSAAFLDLVNIHARSDSLHPSGGRIDLRHRNLKDRVIVGHIGVGIRIGSVVDQRFADLHSPVHRDRKAKTLLAASGAFRVYNTDQLASAVEQAAAGISGANRRAGLQNLQAYGSSRIPSISGGFLQGNIDGPVNRTDDSIGDGSA